MTCSGESLKRHQVIAEMLVAIFPPRELALPQGGHELVDDRVDVFGLEMTGDQETVAADLLHRLLHLARDLVGGADEVRKALTVRLGHDLAQGSLGAGVLE